MAARPGTAQAPSSVAEGLKDALSALTGAMTAPDAVRYAGPLMQLQGAMLDLIHQTTAPQMPGAMPGTGPGGAPPGGGPPVAGPPGAAPGAPRPNLALLQGGGPQGPSAAARPSISPTGTTAETIRRLVAGATAAGGTGT